MLRLEDEIVVPIGFQQCHDSFSRIVVTEAMSYLRGKITSPTTEVIVHIDDRNAALFRTLLQHCDALCHRKSVTNKLRRLRKIKIIDYVDKQKRHNRFVRRTSV